MSEEQKTVMLISYRLRQAEEALSDAAKLIEAQGSPRSVLNRAYYAMFYSVLALLVSIGIQ